MWQRTDKTNKTGSYWEVASDLLTVNIGSYSLDFVAGSDNYFPCPMERLNYCPNGTALPVPSTRRIRLSAETAPKDSRIAPGQMTTISAVSASPSP